MIDVGHTPNLLEVLAVKFVDEKSRMRVNNVEAVLATKQDVVILTLNNHLDDPVKLSCKMGRIKPDCVCAKVVHLHLKDVWILHILLKSHIQEAVVMVM